MSYMLGSTLVCLGLMALGLPAFTKMCRDLDKSNENNRRLDEARRTKDRRRSRR